MDALRFTKSHALELSSRKTGQANSRTKENSPMFHSLGGNNERVTALSSSGDVS